MKLTHITGVLLVLLVVVTVFIPVAASQLLPAWATMAPVVQGTVSGPVVVPAAWALPGATYPWVQPIWVNVGGVRRPVVPANLVGAPSAQPHGLILAG